MIPLKQTVTVKKSGALDEWGLPTQDESVVYKCRIDDSSELVRDKDGNEVVGRATILIKGVANITYDDVLEWIDDFGNTRLEKPLNILVIKDLSGKPLFTKVVV